MVDDVRQLVAQAMSLGGFVANIEVACISVKDVVGRYDVIIMKSVLGGIFRIGHNYSSDVEHLILKIVHKASNRAVFLITLDYPTSQMHLDDIILVSFLHSASQLGSKESEPYLTI